MPARTPPEIKDLALSVGQFIQYWGFKKVHGQIWCHIFLSKQPLDATTLVKRLGVSKALVSFAIKDLLHYDVIRVVGKGGRRKIFFESNPNLMDVICKVLKARELEIITCASDHAKKALKLKPEDRVEVDQQKLEELGEMIEVARSTLATLIESNLSLIQSEGLKTASKK